MAQLVVIRGRKMPSARNSAGLSFLITISTNCTVLATTTMKAISRRYGAWGSTKRLSAQAQIEVTTSTKMFARPMRRAVSMRPLTPRKGHSPRK
jgi:hypothetical protein